MTKTPSNTLTIILHIKPEDVKVLSPNGRPNPHQLARIKSKMRALGRVHTKMAIRDQRVPEEVIWIGRSIHRVTKANIIPDTDNTTSTMKSVIDGMCDILGINDKQLLDRGVTFAHDRDNPHWEITLHYEEV